MMLPGNDGQSHDGVRPLLDGAVVGLKLVWLLSDVFGANLADKGYRPTTAINVMAGVAGLGSAQGQASELILGAMAAAAGMISGLALPFQEGTEEWIVQVPLAVQAALLGGQFLGAPHKTMQACLACDLSLERGQGLSCQQFRSTCRASGAACSLPPINGGGYSWDCGESAALLCVNHCLRRFS